MESFDLTQDKLMERLPLRLLTCLLMGDAGVPLDFFFIHRAVVDASGSGGKDTL